MSLIGIDVGTSSVKCVAYGEDGKLLAQARHELSPLFPKPGYWEQDAEDVWNSVKYCLRQIAVVEEVLDDQPIAIAISASGRENFLADSNGIPLTPAIMGADIRGVEFETTETGIEQPEQWTLSCGHQRERMDPIFRLLWWRKEYPEIVNKASYFFGWQDFLAFRLTGNAVTDKSMASRYQVFDLHSMNWSEERIRAIGIEKKFLPNIQDWGTIIGEVKKPILQELRLPPNICLAVGCLDTHSAAVGVGVGKLGTGALTSGNFENLLIASSNPPTKNMIMGGLSVMPYPRNKLSILSVSPTGSAVLNWARDLLNLSIERIEMELVNREDSPSHVLAIPYLSGSMLYWENRRSLRGALTNLTLATNRVDILKAIMESIAYEHVFTLRLLKREGISVELIRATGGGSNSHWWTQLKADMLNVPIEVIDQPEPGAFGAAILAGFAMGVFTDLVSAPEKYNIITRKHIPNPERRKLHKARLKEVGTLIPKLISST